MYRLIWQLLSVLLCIAAGTALAEEKTATATCNFNRAQQLAVRYRQVVVGAKKKVLGKMIPYGQVWAPGGKPMTMFTNTPVSVGAKDVPTGAFTLFVIPDEKNWTLVISKSTDTSGKYDEHQDLARVPMQVGSLSSPEPQFSVYFAHVAPDQCNMRLDLQKARAFIPFKVKK